MSATRLRDAAKLLRKVAEAATPGPWTTGARVPESSGVVNAVWFGNLDPDVAGPVGEAGQADATYIATMSPPVALALAEWLDSVHDAMVPDPGRTIADVDERHALQLADTILGINR